MDGQYEDSDLEKFKRLLESEAKGPKPPQVDFRRREDILSAVTFAKTIAFILYSIVVPVVTLLILMFLPFRHVSRGILFLTGIAIFACLEWLLYLGVIRGILPSPNPKNVSPFNEHQLALAVAFLSLAPMVLKLDFQHFQAFQVVLNSILCIAVLVFFLTKSMLSRQFRWGVLLVMILPLLQLYQILR